MLPAQRRRMEGGIWLYALLRGILLPLLGTGLGAAMVFFLKRQFSDQLQRILTGFAAGVMAAASFWSLLQPAIQRCEGMGRLAFLPAAGGFLIGVGFLMALDVVTPAPGRETVCMNKTAKMILAVTLHNVPEGMAVGVVYAGWLAGDPGVSELAAFALAFGIAVQNLPEGAIVSMPLAAAGMPRGKAFGLGVLSGAVEPAAAVLTLFATRAATAALPWLLAFAAGAMMFIVVDALIPETASDKKVNAGALSYALGFVLMMILDVALG